MEPRPERRSEWIIGRLEHAWSELDSAVQSFRQGEHADIVRDLHDAQGRVRAIRDRLQEIADGAPFKGLRSPLDRLIPCTGPTCTALVFFRPSPAGARVILDADPSPDGTYVLTPETLPEGALTGVGSVTLGCRALRKDDDVPPGVARYHTHWSSCVNAEYFRERKKRRKS